MLFFPCGLAILTPLRSGEGRGDDFGGNLYENVAEATSGKGTVLPESGVNFAADVQNMEEAAAAEEANDKSIKADFVKKQIEKRLVSLEPDAEGTRSAPMPGSPGPEKHGPVKAEAHEEVVIGESQIGDQSKRERASECYEWG